MAIPVDATRAIATNAMTRKSLLVFINVMPPNVQSSGTAAERDVEMKV
jgi:hypothetical protein